MAKRNIRRRNRRIKFSEESYVEKNYMRNDKAYIPIELNDINDIYMKHDYAKLELSDEFCDYVEEIAYIFPINTDIVLEIHCPIIDKYSQNKICDVIRNNYAMEMDDVDYDISIQNRRSIILIIFGILLLIINMYLSEHLGTILSEVLSIIWWIGIWDAIEIQLLDKTDNKWKRLNYQQIYESEIVFVFDK